MLVFNLQSTPTLPHSFAPCTGWSNPFKSICLLCCEWLQPILHQGHGQTIHPARQFLSMNAKRLANPSLHGDPSCHSTKSWLFEVLEQGPHWHQDSWKKIASAWSWWWANQIAWPFVKGWGVFESLKFSIDRFSSPYHHILMNFSLVNLELWFFKNTKFVDDWLKLTLPLVT